MKRKMIGAAAAYMSGLFFASFFTGGSDWLLLAGLFPVFFILVKLISLTKRDIILIISCFTVAVCAETLHEKLVYDKIVSYSGETGSFHGEITGVEYYDNEKALYTIKGKINGVQPAEITFFGAELDALYGDIMTLEGCEFAVPESTYIFDSEGYYKSKNIYLTISSVESMEITHREVHAFRRAIIEYRERIVDDFLIRLGEENGSLLAGMVFGEKGNIGETDKALVYRCGIGHILAVSGLHVSIIVALLMLILEKLRIGRYLSFAIVNIFMAIMIIIVNSPVSAIRAVIMLDIMYSARLFRRQNDSFNSLAVAVLLICLTNPYVISDRGFLLSVAGTYGIAVLGPYMASGITSEKSHMKLMKNLVVMTCTSLVVMPLSILYFDETSLISPVSNIFMVPLCVAAMIIGIIYTLTGGLVSVLSAARVLIDIVFAVTDKLGRMEITHFSCGSDRLFVIACLCAVFAIFIHLLLKSRSYTTLALAGAVTVFIFCSAIYSSIEHRKFKVTVLGKGANTVVAVSYKGRTDVFDLSGHYASPDYLAKYLSSNGVSEIDSLILTEDVQSQYTAYSEALELVQINEIYSSGDTEIFGAHEHIKYHGERPLVVFSDMYEVRCAERGLEISFNDRTVTVAPVKSQSVEGTDASVYYGNIPAGFEPDLSELAIWLDDLPEIRYTYESMNNFEVIIPSGNGEITVRRL